MDFLQKVIRKVTKARINYPDVNTLTHFKTVLLSSSAKVSYISQALKMAHEKEKNECGTSTQGHSDCCEKCCQRSLSKLQRFKQIKRIVMKTIEENKQTQPL